VLVELGVMEQRHKAVLEVLDGAAVTDVALLYGVSRKRVHKWLRRYAAHGLKGLAGRHPRMPKEAEGQRGARCLPRTESDARRRSCPPCAHRRSRRRRSVRVQVGMCGFLKATGSPPRTPERACKCCSGAES
jgi:transposase-like protein